MTVSDICDELLISQEVIWRKILTNTELKWIFEVDEFLLYEHFKCRLVIDTNCCEISVLSPDVMNERNLAFALRCLTLLVCLKALKIFWRLLVKFPSHQLNNRVLLKWNVILILRSLMIELEQEWTVQWVVISLWNSCLNYVAEPSVIRRSDPSKLYRSAHMG